MNAEARRTQPNQGKNAVARDVCLFKVRTKPTLQQPGEKLHIGTENWHRWDRKIQPNAIPEIPATE
jgi:hypothetical protein